VLDNLAARAVSRESRSSVPVVDSPAVTVIVPSFQSSVPAVDSLAASAISLKFANALDNQAAPAAQSSSAHALDNLTAFVTHAPSTWRKRKNLMVVAKHFQVKMAVMTAKLA